MTTKERPILFSGEMVRAIIDGRKTQTRRVVKPQPVGHEFNPGNVQPAFVEPQTLKGYLAVGVKTMNADRFTYHRSPPYGVPGDHLWVRETIEVLSFGAGTAQIQYRADGSTRIIGDRKLPDRLGSIPSIHVPRQASRITLEVTDVRVERLQDISEGDAIAEGIHTANFTGWGDELGVPSFPEPDVYCDYSDKYGGWLESAALSFQSLWKSINGEGSWDANPWVWVVEFKEVKP